MAASGRLGLAVRFLKPPHLRLRRCVCSRRACVSQEARALGVHASRSATPGKSPSRPSGSGPRFRASGRVPGSVAAPGPRASPERAAGPWATPEPAAAPETLAAGAREAAGLEQARRDARAAGGTG